MSFDYSFVLPPTGVAENGQVREMFDDVRNYVNTLISGGGTGAPSTSQYVTLTTDANLTAERVLTAGAGISLTDNGAGSTVVVANTGVRSLSTTNVNSSFSASTGAITFSFSTTPTFSSIIFQSATGAIGLTPSASVFTSYNLTFPLDTGTSGYVLSTNGATPTATLSWVSLAGVSANTALSNLASVAINTDLLPGSANTIDLGSSTKTWRDVHVKREIVFYDPSGTSTILFKAPTGLASYTLTLPTTAGTSGYVLQTDGSGITSWVAQTSLTSRATTELDNLGTTAVNATVKPGTDNSVDLGSSSKTWKTAYLKTSLIFQQTGVGTNAITVAAPSSVTSHALTLPSAQGASNTVLRNDGSGGLSWATISTIGGASNALDNLSGVAINTSLLPGSDQSINLGSTSKQWLTAFIKNVNAGSSGTAGAVAIYSATASKGTLTFSAADNSGNTDTIVTNATQAGARTYTIPDAGASASFVMTKGTQTVSGTKTFDGQLIGNGTATNDDAATGYIGEFVQSQVTSFANIASTDTFGNVTSISLTAGDWDVWGAVDYLPNSAVAFTATQSAISTNSGNTTTDHVVGYNSFLMPTNSTAFRFTVGAILMRLSISTTTTVYLKARGTYTSGNPQAIGTISARRTR